MGNLNPQPPGGPMLADQLLQGAIDLHHHGYPEVSFDVRTRLEDVDEFELARQRGIAAVVLKSHLFPTVGRAYHLRRLVPGIEIIPSITLNTVVGGFNPIAVESAARQGARMVFMPTWSSQHDLERGGFSKFLSGVLSSAAELKPDRGLRVTGRDGKVRAEVQECLAVAATYDMVVSTGHISPRESIALAECAKGYGIPQVIFAHPDSHSVAASRDEIREMVRLDAICEFCVLGTLPAFQRVRPSAAMEIIAEISAERAVITSDYFFDWCPPAAEALRMLIGTFLQLGMSADDLRTMIRENPARLLARTRTPSPPG